MKKQSFYEALFFHIYLIVQEFPFFVGGSIHRINPTPTSKATLYTKKVLSFKLTTNDYSLSTNFMV